MSTAYEELKRLNQQTFDAEAKKPVNGKDYKSFLQDVLACNFSIKRSTGIIQNKCEMIEFVTGNNPMDREVDKETIKVFQQFGDDHFGVVTCVVTLNSTKKRYRNIKVFSQQPESSWLCVYWQVVEEKQSNVG